MTITNEPKYAIQIRADDDTNVDARLINRQSGKPIPPDEPIFILRGRDIHAIETLAYYQKLINLPNGDEHARAVTLRIRQFQKFASEHLKRMKEPDTVLTDDWNNL